jgi:hypothetical protein
MKKPKAKKETMLAEYDFSSGVKGKYTKLYKQGTYRIVDGKTIRKLTAELRAKNQAAKRRRSS